MYQITLISSTVGNDRFLMKSKRKKPNDKNNTKLAASATTEHYMIYYFQNRQPMSKMLRWRKIKKYITISRNALDKKSVCFKQKMTSC